MEIKLFFLTAFIVNLTIAVKPYSKVNEIIKGVTIKRNSRSNGHKNFQNLFESIAKKDTKESKTYHEILNEETASDQKVFGSMKEELYAARKRNIDRKTNVNTNGAVIKREAKTYDNGFTQFPSVTGNDHTNTSSGLLMAEPNDSNSRPINTSPLPLERMNIQFTCNVCGARNNKYFSKQAYTNGTVIIRCDGCKSYHVIADNLGWIQRMNKKRNIEEIFAEKGIKIRRDSMDNLEVINNRTSVSYKLGSKYANISYISNE